MIESRIECSAPPTITVLRRLRRERPRRTDRRPPHPDRAERVFPGASTFAPPAAIATVWCARRGRCRGSNSNSGGGGRASTSSSGETSALLERLGNEVCRSICTRRRDSEPEIDIIVLYSSAVTDGSVAARHLPDTRRAL